MSDSKRDDRMFAGDEFGLDAVRELLRLISETDVTELQIERGEVKLHIKRGAASPATPFYVTPSVAATLPQGSVQTLPPLASFTPPAAATAPAASSEAHLPPNSQTITAPMVGTYYASPSPKDAPFVRVGDEVRSGDVVGIVEAMKIMNEIESEFAGKVVRLLVNSGQPVEYGQPLMVIEPS